MKLPLNCDVDYFSDFLSPKEANELYDLLINDYRLHEAQLVVMAGEKMRRTDSFKILFSTEQLIAENSHPEEIHGKVHPWKGLMKKLRNKVESFVGNEFEIAMCLYYPNGNYHAPYHFDQQTSGHRTILPSISLGEVREFCFRENTTEDIYTLELGHGSLLLMGEYCQSRYEHSLPINPRHKKGRINITFREPKFR